jgi:hypothetical protein
MAAHKSQVMLLVSTHDLQLKPILSFSYLFKEVRVLSYLSWLSPIKTSSMGKLNAIGLLLGI